MTRFEGEVLARNLDAYLALIADILIRPTFDPAEFARTRQEIEGQIDEAATTIASSASASSCATSTASIPTVIRSTASRPRSRRDGRRDRRAFGTTSAAGT